MKKLSQEPVSPILNAQHKYTASLKAEANRDKAKRNTRILLSLLCLVVVAAPMAYFVEIPLSIVIAVPSVLLVLLVIQAWRVHQQKWACDDNHEAALTEMNKALADTHKKSNHQTAPRQKPQ